MNHTATIKKQVMIEEYYVLRAIKETDIPFMAETHRTAIKEKEFDHDPTPDEIAQFLVDSGADFVSMTKKYRIADGDIPFN